MIYAISVEGILNRSGRGDRKYDSKNNCCISCHHGLRQTSLSLGIGRYSRLMLTDKAIIAAYSLPTLLSPTACGFCALSRPRDWYIADFMRSFHYISHSGSRIKWSYVPIHSARRHGKESQPSSTRSDSSCHSFRLLSVYTLSSSLRRQQRRDGRRCAAAGKRCLFVESKRVRQNKCVIIHF